MTLPDFLHASYALLAEEHQRIDPLKDLLSFSTQLAPASSTSPQVRTTVAQTNDQSMAQLMAMKTRWKK